MLFLREICQALFKMDNKDKHLIVNNPNLAVCWLAGTNKQRFINSDVANNVDELVVGNFW